MNITLDTDAIGIINFFENISGAKIRDCIIDEEMGTVYLIIEEGYLGMAIGKNGSCVKNAEKLLKKKIKLLEYSNNFEKFLKELIPSVSDFTLKTMDGGKQVVEVRVEKSERPAIIGRDGKRLKILKEILKRTHNINDIIVR